MKDIKLRKVGEKTIKTIDRAADLAERMKEEFVRTADRTTADEQATPNEYSSDMLQEGMEDITTEAGHIVVNMGKGAYRTGKSAIQKYRKKRKIAAEQQWQEWEKDTQETPVDEPSDPVSPDEPGPSTCSQSPVEEEVASPINDQQRRAGAAKAPTGDRPKDGVKPSMDGADALPKEQQAKGPAKQRDHSIKTIQKADRSIKQSPRTTGRSAKTMERSVKDTQKTVKTAEQSSRVTIKTAQEAAQVAQRSTQVATQTAQKTTQAAKAAAKTAAEATKRAAKAVVESVKAIIASAKSLFAAIAAGGWVAVVVIIVIMMVGLIVGSSFGVFFSSEDTGSTMTMKSVVQEINLDYQSALNAIRSTIMHDKMETSGYRAVWPEVLAIYAVKVNTDPDNPQNVAVMDDSRKALLEEIFWTMNEISYEVKTAEEVVLHEEADAEGNIIVTETTEVVTTLYITVTHQTAEDMADVYGFTPAQKQILSELLQEDNASMWSAALYGIHSADEQIVAVAESQIGNVGGEPYWRWYGFSSRVEWCACFVSWCANECGYIEAGVIPQFSVCDRGVEWFQERGQWADGTATPVPGMIIFYDWDSPDEPSGPQDGESDHVGIVQKVEDGYVYCIEGNAGDSCIQTKRRIGHYEILGYGILSY